MAVVYDIHENVVTLRNDNGGYEDHDIRECNYRSQRGDRVTVSDGDIPVITKSSGSLTRVMKVPFLILAVLFGFFGAQEFYARHYKRGALCLVFCWTGIPFWYSVCRIVKALVRHADAEGYIMM